LIAGFSTCFPVPRQYNWLLSLDVNGGPAAGQLTIASTYEAADPVAWHQWHHWNLAQGLARIYLDAGKNVLTIHIVT